MQRLFERIDELNAIDAERGALVLWLERAIFVFMTLMALAAPHSIAATQIAWLTGMVLWLVVSFMRPPQKFVPRALAVALWAFFGWSVVTSLVSYAPDISIDKLRGVSLFLIALYVAKNLRTTRAARFLALALITSAMVAVVWTPIERAIGRGVQIYDFQGSCFDQIGLQEGDVLLKIEGRKVNSLAQVYERVLVEKEPIFRAQISRADSFTDVQVSTERIKWGAATPEEALGVKRWNKSRNWRAAGFYGHYMTFAEVLQLIASLTLGIFVASLARVRLRKGRRDGDSLFSSSNLFTFALGACVALMALALLLTVTRASQLAFLVSAAVIVVANGNRRLMFATAAVAIPAALVGLFVLRDMRRVDFIDTKDNSTTWRETVYREGFDLWTKSPRNFTFGVGMDSIKRFAPEWHLFDDGRLPAGHFHSTPLQLVVERGLPALLIWIAILGIYAFRTSDIGSRKAGAAESALDEKEKSEIRNPKSEIDRGITLGALGGLAGFVTSGMVHYNLGDGEVAMAFYFIMGLAVTVVAARRQVR